MYTLYHVRSKKKDVGVGDVISLSPSWAAENGIH